MNEHTDLSFERGLTRSLMLLHHTALPETDFESKMLLHSRIPGTLPLSVRADAEDPQLLYDITSLESVESRFASRKILCPDIALLVDSLAKLLRQLEAYLLPESYILLEPQALFLDPEKQELRFALAPNAAPDFSDALRRLLAWVLEHIDYSSDRTVVLAYRLHQESCREFCSIADLSKLVRINMEKARREQQLEMPASPAEAAPAEGQRRAAALSPDGVFRFTPETTGAKAAAEASTSAGTAAPAQTSSAGIRPFSGSDAAGAAFRSAAVSPFGSANASDMAGDSLPGRKGNTGPLAMPSPDPAAKVPPRSTDIPAPSPILADDWVDDSPSQADYSFPASFQPGAELNPADYGEDMLAAPKSNATGSLLRFPFLKKRAKKEKPPSLTTKLRSDQSDKALKKKLLLCVVFMLALPMLTYFLKGPSLFRRILPVILILEVGVAVITALDCLMLKLPED